MRRQRRRRRPITSGATVDIRGVGPSARKLDRPVCELSRLARRFRKAALRDDRGHPRPAPAQSSGSAASDLSDEAAYAVFQHACATNFSDKLRLYKLYARAQAFAPITKATRQADAAP